MRVYELDPATRYSFRVRGENQEEEDNASEWTYGRNIHTLGTYYVLILLLMLFMMY